MEENSIVNTNNNTNRNIIAVIISIVIFVLIAGIVYFSFIKKDDKPKDNNGQTNSGVENTQNDNNEENEIISKRRNLPKEGVVYKTSNGNKVLKITNIDDEVKKKYSTIDFNYSLYLGEYNGEVALVIDEKIVDDYIVYTLKSLDESDSYEDCSFVVKNTELMDLNYSLKEYESDTQISLDYFVEQIGNKYYIIHNWKREIYDGNGKRLYDLYIGADKNGNIYVIDGGYFKKINKNGEVIKTEKEKYTYSRQVEDLITDDNLYTFVIYNKKTWFYDFTNDKTYELGSSDKYSLCADEKEKPYCSGMAGVSQDNNKLEIYIMSDDNEVVKYYFDTKENKLIKK